MAEEVILPIPIPEAIAPRFPDSSSCSSPCFVHFVSKSDPDPDSDPDSDGDGDGDPDRDRDQ